MGLAEAFADKVEKGVRMYEQGMSGKVEKLCPFRAFGPCPEGSCRFWVESFQDCVLVVNLMRDEKLKVALMDVENWKVAADEANDQANLFQGQVRELGAQLEGMVPREALEGVRSVLETERLQHGKTLEELVDARAELDKAQVIIAELPSMAEMEYGADCIAIRDTEIARLEKELAEARAELEKARLELEEYPAPSAYDAVVADRTRLTDELYDVGKELQDARASLEEARAAGVSAAGRGKKPAKRKRKPAQ